MCPCEEDEPTRPNQIISFGRFSKELQNELLLLDVLLDEAPDLTCDPFLKARRQLQCDTTSKDGVKFCCVSQDGQQLESSCKL